MVASTWQKNITNCRTIVQQNLGPMVVNVVSGSEADRSFWQERLSQTRQDVFRQDGETEIISTVENTRKGNFLGSLNAWNDVKRSLTDKPLPPVMLMNMVFGLGKRLSPFTQALANRKPAFPTPIRAGNQEVYLSTADTASFSAGLWLNHLETNGFRGMIVKWGDEAIIPGKMWDVEPNLYNQVDGIRFVWQTEPTGDLAREKEWVEFDARTHQMTYQYTRQDLASLQKRLSGRGQGSRIGVNLGSLGISYQLLDVAEQVFRNEVGDGQAWIDWDPYTWIGFACQNIEEWLAEAELERGLGKTGLRDLEKRVPGFFHNIQQIREIFVQRYGRLPVIKILDFGEPFWMDWGLHLSLRRSLQALTTDSILGITSRALFDLPQTRDRQGNILVRSTIPEAADIRDSILVDTVITEPGSVIHAGLVVAGRHRLLEMPYGGSVLFCAADEMKLSGPAAIAFKVTGPVFQLGEGDRLAQLYLADRTIELRGNESLVNYDSENYSAPVLGNSISFQDASRRMSMEDTRLVEKRWLERWSDWLV